MDDLIIPILSSVITASISLGGVIWKFSYKSSKVDENSRDIVELKDQVRGHAGKLSTLETRTKITDNNNEFIMEKLMESQKRTEKLAEKQDIRLDKIEENLTLLRESIIVHSNCPFYGKHYSEVKDQLNVKK